MDHLIINWRLYLLISIMVLCIIDLSLTFYYVHVYKQWQPNKPYKLIEMNPLLVFLWNKFGLYIGMFIGAVLILALNYIVGKDAHWIVGLILLLFLCFTMYNHYNNITLLHKLIAQYPTGYLPFEIFGFVEGNNPKPKKLIIPIK